MSLPVLWPYVVTFGLLACRCGGMLSMVPFFGSLVPKRVTAALSVVFAAILVGIVGPMAIASPLALIVAALGEVVIGVAMGLVVRLMFAVAEMAGEIAGLQMGLGFNRLADPLTQESAAVSGRLFSTMAMLLFLAIDGQQMIVSGLADSVAQVPPGQVLASLSALSSFGALLAGATSAALRVAAPVVVALLLTNLAIGLLARAAPQLNLFVFAFGITIGLGMWILGASAGPTFALVTEHLRRIPRLLVLVIGA